MQNFDNPFLKEDVYSTPDLNQTYLINPMCVHANISGITQLMKLCLLTNNYPELHSYIREYIKQHPEELNKQTSNGFTALILAVIYYKELELYNLPSVIKQKWSTRETIDILLEAGADIYLQEHHGANVFRIACLYGDALLLKDLMNRGMDINGVDAHNISNMVSVVAGCTSYPGKIEKLKFMLEHNAIIEGGQFCGIPCIPEEYKNIETIFKGLFLVGNGPTSHLIPSEYKEEMRKVFMDAIPPDDIINAIYVYKSTDFITFENYKYLIERYKNYIRLQTIKEMLTDLCGYTNGIPPEMCEEIKRNI